MEIQESGTTRRSKRRAHPSLSADAPEFVPAHLTTGAAAPAVPFPAVALVQAVDSVAVASPAPKSAKRKRNRRAEEPYPDAVMFVNEIRGPRNLAPSERLTLNKSTVQSRLP